MQNVYFSIFLLFISAILVTILSKCIEENNSFYRKHCLSSHKTATGEEGEDNCQTTTIVMVRFFHYIITLFYCFYIFLFDEFYDGIYVFFYIGILLHWIWFDSCILSKMEYDIIRGDNKEADQTEKENSVKQEKQKKQETHEKHEKKESIIHPHLDIFFQNNTDYFILFQGIAMAVNLAVIFWRWRYNNVYKMSKQMFRMLKMGGLVILLTTQGYLMLKDRVDIYSSPLSKDHYY